MILQRSWPECMFQLENYAYALFILVRGLRQLYYGLHVAVCRFDILQRLHQFRCRQRTLKRRARLRHYGEEER